MNTEQKYVRLGEYDSIIIFPKTINHSKFRNMGVFSAGFCHVHENKVVCYGESHSLEIKSTPRDSYYATKQLFGWEAAEKLLPNK